METENLQSNPTSKKWYDNKVLLIILFFLFPPLGIYGILKHKTDTWKKVVYISPLIFFFGLIVYAVSTFDKYQTALDYYTKKDYMEAYRYFNMVSPDDENYKNAQIKLKQLRPKFDSIVLEERKKEIAESNKTEVEPSKLNAEELQNLKNFQTQWTETAFKDFEGGYVEKTFIAEDSDTIYFQLKKVATTGNWQSTAEIHRSIYQKKYDTLLQENFNNKYNLVKTKISFIPNPEQQKENNERGERKNKIQMQFSAWDGSHSKLKSLVKDGMNDPSSFDHVNTTYEDKGKYILVQMTFRGKNAFGAKVLNSVTAKVDLAGNILSVSDL